MQPQGTLQPMFFFYSGIMPEKTSIGKKMVIHKSLSYFFRIEYYTRKDAFKI